LQLFCNYAGIWKDTIMTAADSVTTQHSEKLEWVARMGYAAKGVIYGTVGLLAAGAAFGWFSGEVGGTRNAIQKISEQPFGLALLLLLIVGLLGYVTWRLTQGIKDTEDKGEEASGWMQRTGFMISGLLYLSLGVYAVSLTPWVGGGDGGDSTKQDLVRTIMGYTWGPWFIAAIGATFVGIGLYQGYRSISKKFKDNWKTGEMTSTFETTATHFAQAGILARAVTFLIMGGLIARAGLTTTPENAKGLGQALAVLNEQSYGPWLLGLVAIGLVMYGLYCGVNARFRSMQV